MRKKTVTDPTPHTGDDMTTQPTPAELKTAHEIAGLAKPDDYLKVHWDEYQQRIAKIIAAHRTPVVPTLSPTFNFDPANDDKIARQHRAALNRIGEILIDLQNQAVERARSAMEAQPDDPAQAHATKFIEVTCPRCGEIITQEIKP